MDPIRPLAEQDIPQIADLHKRVFAEHSRLPIPELREQLRAVFFHSPWYDPALPSLVYVDDSGRIVGFLGVLPRPMSLNGRPVRVAISTQFAVDPASRGLPGVRLLKTFFDGPQDFSLTDGAGEASQKVWEGLGGITSLLYTLHWTRPLRISRYVAALASDRKALAPFATVLKPALTALDALTTHGGWSPFQQRPQPAREALTMEMLLASLPSFTSSFPLRPDYTAQSLGWVLAMARQKRCWGALQDSLVRDAQGGVAGWHLYYVKPGGIAEVLQIAARPECIDLVLDHLFFHAWRDGAVAVSGRLEPRLFKALANKHCFFHAGGSRTLVHSRNQALLDVLYRGDAFFSRLEGEWWMRFVGG
jgi:hypothetical protein